MGIIPALAGNTDESDTSTLHAKDHPRACGEHLRMVGLLGGGEGSSPRLRGTLFDVCYFLAYFGIIPALAGNTGLARALRKAL